MSAVDPLDGLARDLAPFDLSLRRADAIGDLVERWAADAPVLIHAEVEGVDIYRTEEAPGVFSDVALRVDQVLRDDLGELSADDIVLLTVPGGDDLREQTVSTEAPLFYAGDTALVVLDLNDDELALANGQLSVLATRGDAVVACINPSGPALLGCLDSHLPMFADSSLGPSNATAAQFLEVAVLPAFVH